MKNVNNFYNDYNKNINELKNKDLNYFNLDFYDNIKSKINFIDSILLKYVYQRYYKKFKFRNKLFYYLKIILKLRF